MKNNLIIITFICIVIILISGCTSNTSTTSTTPIITKTPKTTIKPPTITPRPVSDTWNTQFAEDTLPSSLIPGKTYKFTLKVFNVGTMPWTFTNHTAIFPIIDSSSDTNLFNPTYANLTKKEIMKSGQNYTWTLSITAPIQRGNYTIKFRMMNNNTTWFGDTFTKDIIVGNIGDEVTFISNSALYYKPLTPNSTLFMAKDTWQNVSITVNNTGRYSWLGDEMQLAAIDYEPNDATIFNPAVNFHFAPDAVIMPGESSTWKYKIQAPSYPGTYNIKYRMKKDGQWFGNTLNVTVKVT